MGYQPGLWAKIFTVVCLLGATGCLIAAIVENVDCNNHSIYYCV